MSRLLPLLLLAACPKTTEEPEAPVVPDTPSSRMVADIARLDFAGLGNPVLRWDWVPPLNATADHPHKALVLLVEFEDVRFERFADQDDQALQLSVYYQKLLFDNTFERKNTLSHFYAAQSGGRYHMDGVVVPPVRLDKPLAAYGAAHRPEGGSWRNDTDPDGLIVDALALAKEQQPEVDWTGFDQWDPKDFDGDGDTDEADGYVDHLIIVYAGKGQHSCQWLRNIDDALNPNVGPEAIDQLSPAQRECADRIWPHRDEARLNEGDGPAVEATTNTNGGVPVSETLWVRSYNMQCEYTEESTFIHETGHSLGLPDIYAMTSTNSTGPWDTMSATADPSPQNFSAWSRMQLGWLEPTVLVPPEFGGEDEAVVHLADLGSGPVDATKAVLIALPPKQRELKLTTLPESSGGLALYSGQGNELNRTATLKLTVPDSDEAVLEHDAWWEIEGGWDFAYIELSADGGKSWERLLPTDRAQMPAKHGHDGTHTKPGLTGISGDLDGDGKNESQADCDPAAEIAHGEDRAGQDKSACEKASWVRLGFDLSPWKAQEVSVRWRYFTDGAAVENGLIIDNLALAGQPIADFEGPLGDAWTLDGFSASPGHHSLLVPHYYLLEYRDPYVEDDSYDTALQDGSVNFFWDPESGKMKAVRVRPRPGVVAWYFDGAYAWSENDPAFNGPGHGYLLVLDSNPNEFTFPSAEGWLQGDPEKFDTHYVLEGEGVQDTLRDSFYRTMCYARRSAYYSPGSEDDAIAEYCKHGEAPPVESVEVDGKKAKYVYDYIDQLPGEGRDPWRKVGEMYDFRVKEGEHIYRLRDRSLRYFHTVDSPFSPELFDKGVTFYDVEEGKLVETGTRAHPATTSFSDADGTRWLNPHLPFGGVAVPAAGVQWEVSAPAEGAPEGTRATVTIRWEAEADQTSQ